VLDAIDQSPLVMASRNRAMASSKSRYCIKVLPVVGVTCLVCLTLCLLVMKHQTLLVRCFDSTRNRVSHPLERLSTSKTQHPLRK
jgi:hypothetical protein